MGIDMTWVLEIRQARSHSELSPDILAAVFFSSK